jgi:hypothetical protein
LDRSTLTGGKALAQVQLSLDGRLRGGFIARAASINPRHGIKQINQFTRPCQPHHDVVLDTAWLDWKPTKFRVPPQVFYGGRRLAERDVGTAAARSLTPS